MAAEAAALPGCGCKGIRSCLRCEQARGPVDLCPKLQRRKYHFTYHLESGLAVADYSTCLTGWAFPFPGVFLAEKFVNEEEEAEMVNLMDNNEWKLSQSGRRKQDYGPKVNFKKRKLKVGCFSGLPCNSLSLMDRMTQCSVLKDFLPVEQCNLDYRPEHGSGIDPHFDDWWLWGKRLVSINLLSETKLSMTCDSEDLIQLHLTEMVPNAQQCDPINGNSESICDFHGDTSDHCKGQRSVSYNDVEIAIHMPRRSLIVLYGNARYKWKHGIYRQDIQSRRICCTFRELSEEFGEGGKQEALGKVLLDIALSFKGVPG
ncbi:alpha-ketoglutarate-dependent dioxygenase alkB homolog 4 isoform X1 [Amblyraja radiata]|uniref:alpha-ketoglutarate-dependent dioxygenase alkB homolog 4 isoform X1 n=2 Tax=Amblyraja radiata TaxID=386614 RepID=UPI0014024FDA|nr:alpha-ketoglutarate-dependent dioxygenase alkB homolog 4 isoform X1 [Amblyraja radiata]